MQTKSLNHKTRAVLEEEELAPYLVHGMAWIDLAVTITLTVIVAVGGGYVAGLAMDRFGSPGAVCLWGVGAVSGFIAARILPRNELVSCYLVAGLVAAMLIAEATWIGSNTVGTRSLFDSVAKLGMYFRMYQFEAVMAGLFTIGGIVSAYRQTAK